MKCAHCGGKVYVVETELRKHDILVYRRRGCRKCGRRFSTYEIPIDDYRKERKMRTVKTIETAIDDLKFGYWDVEGEEFIPINEMTDAELNQAATLLGCSPLMLDALMLFSDSVRDSIAGDLKDIWRMVDRS